MQILLTPLRQAAMNATATEWIVMRPSAEKTTMTTGTSKQREAHTGNRE